VRNMHWLILIPSYFFAALALLLLAILTARLLRLRVSVNPLVTGAVIVALGIVVAPLVAGWMTLADYNGRVLLALMVATFAAAGLDTLLQSRLPLPLDEELTEL
jgi:uncharacterized membrane protein YedE/YeeE